MEQSNQNTEELQEASNALYYEISMLKYSARGLASDITGESTIHNSLVESFLIHARLLIEFLYKDKRYKDNVMAADFFSTPEKWRKIRPEKSKLLNETFEGSHKLLAHLSYTRLQVKKTWPYLEIAKEIEAVLNVLLQNVSEDLLGSRWKTSSEEQKKDRQ
jgi:hypothetical protein